MQHITALGVTLSYNFSMAKHIDTVMSSCARTLYGLRTLRAHGMPQAPLQLFFRSTALSLSLIPGRGMCHRPNRLQEADHASWVGRVDVIGGVACLHVSRTAQEQMLCRLVNSPRQTALCCPCLVRLYKCRGQESSGRLPPASSESRLL